MPDVVVAAAILDPHDRPRRALVAQRAYPTDLAGRWEFPGGKVERGERDEVALRRECREELGVEVRLGERLGPDVDIAAGRLVLRVWTAYVERGEPVAREHAALRWITAGEVDALPWIAADRPIVRALRRLLERQST